MQENKCRICEPMKEVYKISLCHLCFDKLPYSWKILSNSLNLSDEFWYDRIDWYFKLKYMWHYQPSVNILFNFPPHDHLKPLECKLREMLDEELIPLIESSFFDDLYFIGIGGCGSKYFLLLLKQKLLEEFQNKILEKIRKELCGSL